MRHIIRTLLAGMALLSAPAPQASATPSADKVLVFELREEIGASAWIHTSEAIRKAQAERARAIVMHMNTYGGEVSFADSIRAAILACRVPFYAFIDVNAASAGALIATACDSIFMTPGASIGAATVVSGADGEKMPDKYQSYMRAMMRSTAEAHPYEGPDSARQYLRDPRLAEAFVDEAVSIPGIIDSAHVLTLTAREAVRLGYCEAIVPNLEGVVERVAPGAAVVRYEPSALDDIKGGLLSTSLRGFLILLIIGGLYFEIQSPGIGLALLVSIGAAVLYFAPLYIDGLAQYWEVLLFLAGVGLLAAEVFVIPGFGIAGVAGIACVVTGLALSLVGNDGLSFEAVPTRALAVSLWTVIISLSASVALCAYLGSRFFRARKGSPLARLTLEATQEEADGFVGVEKDALEALIGQRGVARTDLRPGGKVDVGGATHDAISDGQFVERGSAVVVTATSSGQLVVKALER